MPRRRLRCHDGLKGQKLVLAAARVPLACECRVEAGTPSARAVHKALEFSRNNRRDRRKQTICATACVVDHATACARRTPRYRPSLGESLHGLGEPHEPCRAFGAAPTQANARRQVQTVPDLMKVRVVLVAPRALALESDTPPGAKSHAANRHGGGHRAHVLSLCWRDEAHGRRVAFVASIGCDLVVESGDSISQSAVCAHCLSPGARPTADYFSNP